MLHCLISGVDGYFIPTIVCDIYFEGKYPCHGGLLALDGASGKEIWRHYSEHEIYGVNCEADLNKDSINDCLAGGRAGVGTLTLRQYKLCLLYMIHVGFILCGHLSPVDLT